MGITRQVWRERRCGNTGKKDNCQASIFLGYASRKGATLLDRRLYLPESWFEEDHQTRWQDCRIPDRPLAETKHELAAQLVEKVMADGRLTARSRGVRRGIRRLARLPGTLCRGRIVAFG